LRSTPEQLWPEPCREVHNAINPPLGTDLQERASVEDVAADHVDLVGHVAE
jgi:hypothetical protein